MGVAVSSSRVVSATLSSSGGGLLTLYPCSSLGSLPQDTVLHKLLQFGSFPWGVDLLRLLQCESPEGSQLLPENLLQWGLHSLHRATDPARSLLQHGLPKGSQPPSDIHLLRRGSPPWAAGGDLLHRGPPRAAGAQPTSPQSSSWAAGEALLQHLEHLLPLLLH